MLELIAGYADTWRLLLEYDEDRLATPPGARPSVGVLDHDRAIRAIAEFKSELMARREASSLFGNPRGDALAAILGSIEQTMFGESLYRSREEKAAHLLYFIVKDHPFTDGNKRIGSLLFLLYLKQEGLDHRLNPEALTALTLLIAESAPTGKDLMVRLIINLLAEPAALNDPPICVYRGMKSGPAPPSSPGIGKVPATRRGRPRASTTTSSRSSA